MEESSLNKNISYKLPDEIQSLKNEFGSSELFLRTFPPLPPNQISLVPIFTSTKFITKL